MLETDIDKFLDARKSEREKELKKITKTSEGIFHTLSSFFESRSILDRERFSQDKGNKLFNNYTERYGVKRTFKLKTYAGNFNDFFNELITGRLRKLYLRHDTPNIGVAIKGLPERRFRKDKKEESEEYKIAFNLLYSEEAKPIHQAYLISEILENFTTFDKLYTTYEKEDLIQYLRDTKGLERMLACAILFDEYDFNTGNFGIVEENGEKKWKGIDFGQSYFVRTKEDIDSSYITRRLNCLLAQMKRILVRDENFNIMREYNCNGIIENLLDKNLLFSELEDACDFFIQNHQLVESTIGRDIDLYSKVYNKEMIPHTNGLSYSLDNEITVGENTFLMSNGKFISETDQNLTLSKFYAQRALERFEKIKRHAKKLKQILNLKAQNQDVPSASGDAKNETLGYEQPQKPPIVTAPSPTVIGRPQEKPIMAASSSISNATNGAADTQQQNPQTKPKNNRSYYIGGSAAVGLAMGLIAAYFAGADIGVFIAAVVVGALLGAAVGYGVSRCLYNPKVGTLQPQEVQLPQSF